MKLFVRYSPQINNKKKSLSNNNYIRQCGTVRNICRSLISSMVHLVKYSDMNGLLNRPGDKCSLYLQSNCEYE